MTLSSSYTFTTPIRYFKENDPYYWELDNVPLNQLENNTNYLKDIVDGLTSEGGISRSGFSELKPYVNSVDNIIRVKPGRYTARINDAYNKTPLQKLQLLNAVVGGDIHQYTTRFATSSFNGIISRLYSDSGVSALSMNGLTERIFSWRVGSPDAHIPTGSITNLPSTGSNGFIDGSPVVFPSNYIQPFTQIAGAFTDLNKLSNEFCKQWRGVARTAIVDCPNELSITVPPFNVNDFKRTSSDGVTLELIPNAVIRIDLVFMYSHPVDASSTTIIKYSGGTPQTITTPTLGILKGAGAILSKNSDNPITGNLSKSTFFN